MIWCKFDDLNVGKEVADMHYGLDGIQFDVPHRVMKCISAPMSGGWNFIKLAVGHGSTNKMLVVVEMSAHPSLDAAAVLTCAYTYDDRHFGLVVIEVGKDVKVSDARTQLLLAKSVVNKHDKYGPEEDRWEEVGKHIDAALRLM